MPTNKDIELEITPLMIEKKINGKSKTMKRYCIVNKNTNTLESEEIFFNEKDARKRASNLLIDGCDTKHRRIAITSDNFTVPVRIPPSWIAFILEDIKTTKFSEKQLSEYLQDILTTGFEYRNVQEDYREDAKKEWKKTIEGYQERYNNKLLLDDILQHPTRYRDVLAEIGIDV